MAIRLFSVMVRGAADPGAGLGEKLGPARPV